MPDRIDLDDPRLERIRRELFYGIGRYTKNQPDFVVDRFEAIGPKGARRTTAAWVEALAGEDEILFYVHFPFCRAACTFCNTFPLKAEPALQDGYVDALLTELGMLAEAGLFSSRRARCVYFGGGTPTVFTDAQLGRVLEGLRAAAPFADGADVSVEAHPATLDGGRRLPDLAALGVTRVSIGCQTFDPEVQRHCNRRHTPEQIGAVVAAAREVGLAVNVDMMIGLPGQTVGSVERDLEVLDRIRPSAVEYIRHEVVNDGVKAIYRQHPELRTPDDELFGMLLKSQNWLTERGYEMNGRYTDGRQWPYRYHWIDEMPIVGLGLRSRSYAGSLFLDKHDEPDTYVGLVQMGIVPVAQVLRLADGDRMHRTLFLSLQRAAGLSVPGFVARYGVDPRERFGAILAPLVELGCVQTDDAALRLTPLGMVFVEDVCDRLLDAVLAEAGDGVVRRPHSHGVLDEADTDR